MGLFRLDRDQDENGVRVRLVQTTILESRGLGIGLNNAANIGIPWITPPKGSVKHRKRSEAKAHVPTCFDPAVHTQDPLPLSKVYTTCIPGPLVIGRAPPTFPSTL